MSIPYQVFEHAQPPASLEEAASLRDQLPEQVIRSILFKCHDGDYFMVLMAGPGQISWRKLRHHLGVSRISMASAEDVLAVTGSVVGAVTPLGLPRPLRILADVSVFQSQQISLGSGVRGTAIILKSTDLQRALGKVELGIFS
jgi:Cys-tRNA(Pro)/Cys-tRNA(Cys) deacylase